jgi:inner membrane transporter RhtA
VSRGASSALDRFSPEALFVVSGVAQYTGAVIAVGMFDDVAPASVAWIRVAGAALLLLAVSHRARRPWTRPELASAAVFGVASAVMNLCFYLAIDRLDLGKSVVIEFIGPIAVAVAFTRTRRNAAALALAVAGVVVLSGVEVDAEPLGLVFVFCASIMWAVYIVIGRRVAQLERGVAGLGVGLAIGAVAIAPIGLPQSGPLWHSATLLLSGVLVGLLSNAVGYGIDQHVLRRIPVRRFAVLLALLPVTAMIVGFVALDQRPSVLDALGAGLVIAAVVVQERDELTATTAEPTPA